MKSEAIYDGGLKNIGGAIEEALAKGLFAGAEIVAQLAGDNCPSQTGALRSSITTEKDGMTVTVTADENYAAAVEFGTSETATRPFLVPSLFRSADEILSALATSITDQI